MAMVTWSIIMGCNTLNTLKQEDKEDKEVGSIDIMAGAFFPSSSHFVCKLKLCSFTGSRGEVGGSLLFVYCYCSVTVSVSVEGSKEQTHTHNGVEVEWSRWSHCLSSVLSPSSTSCDFWWSNVNKALHKVIGQVNLPWMGTFVVIIFLQCSFSPSPCNQSWFPMCELGNCLPFPFIFSPSMFLTPLASAIRYSSVMTWESLVQLLLHSSIQTYVMTHVMLTRPGEEASARLCLHGSSRFRGTSFSFWLGKTVFLGDHNL